jgi:hypothetical protein
MPDQTTTASSNNSTSKGGNTSREPSTQKSLEALGGGRSAAVTHMSDALGRRDMVSYKLWLNVRNTFDQQTSDLEKKLAEEKGEST